MSVPAEGLNLYQGLLRVCALVAARVAPFEALQEAVEAATALVVASVPSEPRHHLLRSVRSIGRRWGDFQHLL